MRKPYFKTAPGAPQPLSCTVERVVRFEEVDPLAIVWHGRYPSFFEDARVQLGEKFGIGYMDFYNQGILAPIKQMHVDYVKPLKFRERFTIEALLHWTEAARLNHEFILRNSAGEITTTGYTVQLFMDEQHNMLMLPPAFFENFCRRWKEGLL